MRSIPLQSVGRSRRAEFAANNLFYYYVSVAGVVSGVAGPFNSWFETVLVKTIFTLELLAFKENYSNSVYASKIFMNI